MRDAASGYRLAWALPWAAQGSEKLRY